MPYFPKRTQQRYFSTSVSNSMSGLTTVVSSGNDEVQSESRSGMNHSHNNVVYGKMYPKYTFSKDGQFVNFLIGIDQIPIRKYKWVRKDGGRGYKEYYILYITRPNYVKIPKSNLTYRYATSKSTNIRNILKPNNLDYQMTTTNLPYYFAGHKAARTFFPPNSFATYGSGWPRGQLDGRSQGSIDGGYGPFRSISANPSLEVPALSTKALTALYNKVADRFPDVGTMVGESKETASMIRKLLNEGVDLVADLIRKDARALSGRLKLINPRIISDAWLTYQYGVAPLVIDYQRLRDLPGQTGVRTYKSTRSVTGKMSNSTQRGLTIFSDNLEWRCSVTYGVIMDADLPAADKAAAMNLLNPIGVGYNLIPFSFMFDWIVDVGSYLNSSSALQFGYVHGWKTIVIEQRYRSSWKGGATTQYWYSGTGLGSKTIFSCVRTYLDKDKFPDMPGPKIDLNVSDLKGLNALAIAIQRSGR